MGDKRMNEEEFASVFPVGGSITRKVFAAFKGEDGKIKLVALDKKNSNSNQSSITVGETDIEFTAYIKAENMKIIPGDYDVALSKAKIAHFINKKVQVQYWIALEADSTF